MVRRIIVSFITSISIVSLLFTGVAHAQQSDPILSGLQYGVNLMIPPSSTNKTANVYYALGDSVAAGWGLPQSTAATARDKQCGRSPQAYATQVSKSTKLKMVNNSCKGATAGDLFTSQSVPGPNIPPQLNAAFSQGTPRLITVTAGANDAHWSSFLQQCYVSNCATSGSTKLANAYLKALQLKLYYLFSDIQSRSGGTPPTVVMTGYYNPLSANCVTPNSSITASEITWMNAEVAALNQTIKNVSSHYSFVRFAPVDFTGHDVCSSTPWIQGLNATGPFHPTATGQKAIAAAVIRALQ